MAHPTPSKYARAFSFTGAQSANPNNPPPGIKVDSELDEISVALGGTIDALDDIRQADGTIAPAAIGASLTVAAVAAGRDAGAAAGSTAGTAAGTAAGSSAGTAAGTAAGTTAGTSAGATAGAAAGATAGTNAANVALQNILGGIVTVEGYGAISGTDPANAATNTKAFNDAFAAARHVTCRDGAFYMVNAITVPAIATGLSGKATLFAAPSMAEDSAVLTIVNNTAGFTLDGPIIDALRLIVTTTGTITTDSTTITGIASTAGMAVGQLVSAPRVPAGSKIVSINAGAGSIVIDQTPVVYPLGTTGTIKTFHDWDAVRYWNCTEVTIRNTRLAGRHGGFGVNCSKLSVLDNECFGYIAMGFEYDDITGNNSQIRHDGNTIFNGINALFGIYVNSGSDISIRNNTIKGTDVHPIMLTGYTHPVQNFVIVGNIINGTLNEGIFLNGSLHDGVVASNVMTLYGSADNGISIDATGGFAITDLLVMGNHINTPGCVGIFIGEVGSPGSVVVRVRVIGNDILNPNTTHDDTFQSGIQIWGAGAQDITVAHNSIVNYTGRMRYAVAEVAGTDGAPNQNRIGPNTGTPGSVGTVSKLGSGTLVYETPLAA